MCEDQTGSRTCCLHYGSDISDYALPAAAHESTSISQLMSPEVLGFKHSQYFPAEPPEETGLCFYSTAFPLENLLVRNLK